MRSLKIEEISIAKIRVMNPRERNQKTFRSIIANIEQVGLKKPITVFRRKALPDGTEYDLVCGQGRMEAIAALGGTRVPALITMAPQRERYLMSLVENIARKRPPVSDLMSEVQSLQERGYSSRTIAQKLGFGSRYIEGIVRLLRSGEKRLANGVAAGTIPLKVAITLAAAPEGAVQNILADAYERGEIRGAKLLTVQKILSDRATKTGEVPSAGTTQDLAREYERHTAKQRALVRRASLVHERLVALGAAFERLLSDQTFVALLRAERLESVPALFTAAWGHNAKR